MEKLIETRAKIFNKKWSNDERTNLELHDIHSGDEEEEDAPEVSLNDDHLENKGEERI